MSEQKKQNLPATPDQLAGNFLQQIGKALPDYALRKYDQNSFLKSAMIAIVSNDQLVEAVRTDAGRKSLFHALRYAASTGLSLNPQEGKAALIPYSGKVQYQVMKNGMIDLAMESGAVDFITSDVVRMNDKFSIEKTSGGDKYTFSPALDDRGDVRGFYAALKMKSGHTHVKWMTVREMEEHRDNYSAMYKSKPDASPWKKSFIGMGVKTVLKSLLRNVSISSDLDNAIGTDDFFESDFSTPGVSPDEAYEKLKSGATDAAAAPAADAGSIL